MKKTIVICIAAVFLIAFFLSQKAFENSLHNHSHLTASVIDASGSLEIQSLAQQIDSLTDQLVSVGQSKSNNTEVSSSTSASSTMNPTAMPIIRAVSDTSSQSSDVITIAKNRQKLMIDLAQKNPSVFLNKALSTEKRGSLPQSVLPYVEEQKTIAGKMTVIHQDDFKNEANDKYFYKVFSGDSSFEFYPTSEIPEVTSQVGVNIRGYVLGNTLVGLSGDNSVQLTSALSAPDSVGNQKTLVLLVEFANSGPEPFNSQTAADLVFNGGFQKFYNEQSYGQVSFSGNAMGWIKIPSPYPKSACNAVGILTPEIHDYLANYNVNPGNYGRIIYLISGPKDSYSCSDIGKSTYYSSPWGYFDLSETWISLSDYKGEYDQPFKWNGLDNLLSHEMGHALGVSHANFWDCGDESMYGTCTHREYGNPFDIMGTGQASLHFNAFYKELLGWIKPSSEITITQSGRYTLNPIETGKGTLLAKIQTPSPEGSITTPFYLEFRQPIGFDKGLARSDYVSVTKGVFVNHIVQSGLYNPPAPELIDASPKGAKAWYADVTNPVVTVNSVFRDLGRKISVGPVISSNSSQIVFDVDLGDFSLSITNPSKDDSFNVPDKDGAQIMNIRWKSNSLTNRKMTIQLRDGKENFVMNLAKEVKNEDSWIWASDKAARSLSNGNYKIRVFTENGNGDVVATAISDPFKLITNPPIQRQCKKGNNVIWLNPGDGSCEDYGDVVYKRADIKRNCKKGNETKWVNSENCPSGWTIIDSQYKCTGPNGSTTNWVQTPCGQLGDAGWVGTGVTRPKP